jgi:hypothetical protein
MRLWIAIALVLGTAACRGDEKECDQACRNGYTISFWAKQDPLIQASPAEHRDLVRRQKLVQLDAEVDRGIDLCVSQCVAADDRERAKCMIKATTNEQVKACMPAD